MRVLIACEFTGTVRDAFKAAGHHAVSCDLLPSTTPGLHYQGDVADLLDGWEPVTFSRECDPNGDGWCSRTDVDPATCRCLGPTMDEDEVEYSADGLLARPRTNPHWDMMVAHPPCTDLANSGARWFAAKGPERLATAVAFVRRLAEAPIAKIAIENPVGRLSREWRKPDQIIQPYWFGDEATKTTCLWLKGLPPLVPDKMVGKGERHVTKSGRSLPVWYNLPPSEDCGLLRSKTFPGFARAMAEQWGK
jgi:hypothetical protein